jgi:hypothetical protein
MTNAKSLTLSLAIGLLGAAAAARGMAEEQTQPARTPAWPSLSASSALSRITPPPRNGPEARQRCSGGERDAASHALQENIEEAVTALDGIASAGKPSAGGTEGTLEPRARQALTQVQGLQARLNSHAASAAVDRARQGLADQELKLQTAVDQITKENDAAECPGGEQQEHCLEAQENKEKQRVAEAVDAYLAEAGRAWDEYRSALKQWVTDLSTPLREAMRLSTHPDVLAAAAGVEKELFDESLGLIEAAEDACIAAEWQLHAYHE